MISYKFLIVLALISGAALSETTPVTTTTTTTSTTSFNSCATATLGQKQPTTAADCTSDTSMATMTCCYINMNMGTQTYAGCTPILTASMSVAGSSLGTYFSSALSSYNATMNSFSCSSAYVSVSFVLLFIAALLF